MLGLQIDMADVERVAKNLGASADQIPFAASLALNEATELARSYLIRVTWPTHVVQRNTSFISAALTTREMRASKTSLSTEIYQDMGKTKGRVNLWLHAMGGVRRPRRGRSLAVPVAAVRAQRDARGVPKSLQPYKLTGKKGERIGDAIYERTSKGKLRLLYVLKPTTRVPKDVPFFEDYRRVMQQALMPALARGVARAMATRRVR